MTTAFKRILLTLLLLATPAMAQLNEADKAGLKDVQLLENPGFEHGIAKWTAAGSSTLAATTTASNVGYGRAAASWDAAAASDTLTSNPVSVPVALQGGSAMCDASVWYKGGDTNLTLQVVDGSANVLASQALVAATNYAVAGPLSFPCPTSGTVALRISASANAAVVYVDQAFLGVSGATPGAIVTAWESWTPTGGWIANTTYAGKKRRVGDTLEGEVKITLSGAPTATTLSFDLPAGHTPDTSKMADTTNGTAMLGEVTIFDASAAATANVKHARLSYSTGSSFIVYVYSPTNDDYSTVNATNPITFASGDTLTIYFRVPIVEFGGGGFVATQGVEYVSNSGTWDATDSTSFAYGASGSAMGGALTTNRSKRVRFSTSVSATDKIEVQVSQDRVNWVVAQQFIDTAGKPIINAYDTTGTGNVSAGVFWRIVSGTPTDIDVFFFRYAALANDDTPAVDWQNTWYWRVVKHTTGVPVGIALASSTAAGLVQPYSTSGVVYAGTYTPTVSCTNCTATSVKTHNYTRVGNIVTVTGAVVVTVTTTATDTAVVLSVPVTTSNFADNYQGHGAGALQRATIKEAAYCLTTTGAQTMTVFVPATAIGSAAASALFTYSCSYKIQ